MMNYDEIISLLTKEPTYYFIFYLGVAFAIFTFVASQFIIAPYGRFASKTYGIELDPRFGWWLMEIMATVSFGFFYFQGPNYFKPVPLFFALHYAMHYSNRGWFFPLHIKVAPRTKSSFSITVALTGVFVTSMHGYLNALWYSKFCNYLEWNWLQTPTCIFGLVLYHISFWSTIYSEHIMRNLRKDLKPDQPRYIIPYGFLFQYITSPQYFTELTGFLGWTIMTWSPAGVFIFLISCANLIPRAIATHKWYLEKFDDYPKDRRILIPFLY